MGLLNHILKKEKVQENKGNEALEPMTVYAPVNGKVIPLNEIPDPIFSEGTLGPGCGINPDSETVYAPFNGEVTQVAETKHAVGITSNDGIELLIHVGMDTVEMNGKGFETYVKMGQKVYKGDKLMRFSLSDITDAGFSTVTAVVVCNADEAGEPDEIVMGQIRAGEQMIHIKAKE